MLVGDSKIGQWQPAFEKLAKRAGWEVLTTTKSFCALTDAEMSSGTRVQDDCRQWGRTVMKEILRASPDVVVTSQVHDLALPPGQMDPAKRTQAAMVDGLQRYWRTLQAHGIKVVVLLDNPMPTTHPVDRCVEDHPESLSRCSFPLLVPLSKSAAPTQLEAASLRGVGVIDMASAYCPGKVMCPAVIGNVLIYRNGSHLTASFARSATSQLEKQFCSATAGLFCADGTTRSLPETTTLR